MKINSIVVSIATLVYANISGQSKFTNVTEQAGIDHQFSVYEGFLGGGACALDINNDGFQDIFLTGGMGNDRLYLNNGDGTFKDIAKEAGLSEANKYVTQGVASADVNKDGFVDIFITTNTRRDEKLKIPRAKNLLFINNGNNTFTESSDDFGIGEMMSFSTGIAFGDINKDGYPDANIGNYFHEYTGALNVINDATIVSASTTAKGYLLINEKGKKFVNAYEEYGLTHKGFGFGGTFTDYDNDGDLDLYICNDFGYKASPNFLLENQFPNPKFAYVEESKGMDIRANAMTSAVGDYDNNGWLDYFITNIKFNLFMVGFNKAAGFIDKASELGTRLFTISWGANFADFDQDGDVDLFVANGDLNPNCTPMFNYYFQNDSNKYTEIASKVGVNNYGIGRGSIIFDLENDGDMDLLVVNQKPVLSYPIESKTVLYRNDSTFFNWLEIDLKGTVSDTRGLGSRIKVFAGDLQMIREIDGGASSHLSQNTSIAHFGLGEHTMIDSLWVDWSTGYHQILYNQKVNQKLSITEPLEKPKEETNSFLKIVLGLCAIPLTYFIYRKYSKNEK